MDTELFRTVAEDDFIDFLEHFIQLQGVLSRLDGKHKKVAEIGRSFYKKLQAIFNASKIEALCISELHNNIQFNDAPLSPKAQNDPVVSAFVIFMLENNILAITFQREATHSIVMEFMELLATSRPRDDMSEALKKRKISTITVEPQTRIRPEVMDETGVSIFDDEAFGRVLRVETESRSSSEDAQASAAQSPKIGPKTGLGSEERGGAEPASDKGSHQLRITVKVGAHELQGAKILIRDRGKTLHEGQSGKDLVFDLAPGEFEVEVEYEQYKVKEKVEIPYESKVTELSIDLQKIFDY